MSCQRRRDSRRDWRRGWWLRSVRRSAAQAQTVARLQNAVAVFDEVMRWTTAPSRRTC